MIEALVAKRKRETAQQRLTRLRRQVYGGGHAIAGLMSSDSEKKFAAGVEVHLDRHPKNGQLIHSIDEALRIHYGLLRQLKQAEEREQRRTR